MCGDDYSSGWGSSDGGFFSSGWGDSDGDGYTSISEALEYDYLYKSTTGEDFDDEGDSAYFSSSGCSAGSSYSGKRVSKTGSSSSGKTAKETGTKGLYVPKKKITSLWDDRWELVSLVLGVIYFASAIFVFSKFEKIGLYVLEPMAIVALLIITLVAGVFVWSMLYFGRLFCKHLDPYPDYFNELPKKPWNIYGEPESDKTWFTFFLFYSVFLLMAFDPEGTKNILSLTDKGTNIFMAMVFFTPIFFFLILKIIKTVKLIKVKEELMRDLPKKKTPIKINPGKIFTAIIVIGLLASGVSVVSENKEKADAEAEILYREIKTYIAAEQYDKAEANLEKMEKLNRGLYKNTKAFSLF